MNTTRVRVVRWLKQEGNSLRQGEALVELETEKVNYELISPVGGVLLKIIARESDDVPVGEPLCHIGPPENDTLDS
jgi:pyruvate/2-oxoglutarate dehydrogenase complex dihydrolipoamide acyltransferase (E2) component